MRGPTVVLIASLLPGVAHGGDGVGRDDFAPGRRLSLGAGGGVAVGPARTTGHCLVEATLTGLLSRRGADWGDTLVKVPNLSMGASFGGLATYFYGEISGYLLLSVGGGAGYRFASSRSQLNSGAAYHVFVGLPIGTPMADPYLGLFGFAGMPYLEPYYRAQVGWSAGTGTIHEIGLLLRMSFGKQWSISF
jgi:hypothetical protein